MIPPSFHCRTVLGVRQRRWSWCYGTAWLLLVFLMSSSLHGQKRPAHRLYHGDMPPGAIGHQQARNQGSWRGYLQPVEIRVPESALIAPAVSDSFVPANSSRTKVCQLVGIPYRFRVQGAVGGEPLALYPSIELIDRTHPPPAAKLDFPIPIELTEDDLRQAAAGKYITRVIYIEDPDFASAFVHEADAMMPFFDVGPTEDPLAVADDLGRPVAIIKLGNRAPVSDSAVEKGFFFGSPPLEQYAVSQQVAPARYDPSDNGASSVVFEITDSANTCPLPSPSLTCLPTCEAYGPRDEYICDGGDDRFPARVNAHGAVDGVEPTDAIIQYRGVDGQRHIQPSNRTCIYAPRFVAVRKVVSFEEYNVSQWAGGVVHEELPNRFNESQPAIAVKQPESTVRGVHTTVAQSVEDRKLGLTVDEVVSLRETENGTLPFEDLSIVALGVWDDSQSVRVAEAAEAAVTWSLNQAPQIAVDADRVLEQRFREGPQVTFEYHLPDGKPCLRLIKLATRQWAHPGETIDFTLRFDNVGPDPVSDMTLIDNLTTRLEYVPDSQSCDRPAKFSAEENEAESLKLQWRITETLETGEGGVVRFQCRVR